MIFLGFKGQGRTVYRGGFTVLKEGTYLEDDM